MSGIGFGLEKIGILALRWPKIASALIILVTAVCLFHFPQLRFNGDVTAVLPDKSQAFLDYQSQKTNFRNFSRDIAVMVESPRLMTVEGMEEIRNLQLELIFTEGVGNIYSVFSIPKPDPQTGEMPTFLPDEFESDEQVRESVKALLEAQPQAKSLISPDKNAALLFVTLDAGMQDASDADVYVVFNELKKSAAELLPDDFKVHYSG